MTSNHEEVLAIVELAENNTLQLPDDMMSGLRKGDRFVVVRTGDSFLLKRMHPPRITDLVAETPVDEPPLTLEEISEIVHEVRRQQAEEE